MVVIKAIMEHKETKQLNIDHGNANDSQKTCDNCKLFTDFGACMKTGYDLTRCINNNYSEFEAKN